MKVTLTIPDEKFEQLEKAAKGSVQKFLNENLDEILKLDTKKLQIILESEHLAKLSNLVGGKTLKTGDDVVKLLEDNFRISVNGIDVFLCPEDANALKEQHCCFDHIPWNEYVSASIQEALCSYLFGSTRGILV